MSDRARVAWRAMEASTTDHGQAARRQAAGAARGRHRAPTPPRRSGRGWPRRRWRSASTASCAISAAPLPDGVEIGILTDRDPEALALIRHDAAHVMAEAVQELYPGTKVTIGPAIENGFYYDFEFPPDVKITDADLEPIEEAMRAHIAAKEEFSRRDVPVAEAIEIFKGQDEGFKVELIEDLVARRRRRDRLALPQRPLRGPLPRPPRPRHRPDQGDQAQLGRRRLLARRRDPRDADPDLRHRLLLEEGPRRSTSSGSSRRRPATTAASAPSSGSSCCARRRRGCRSGSTTGPRCCA